jgi:hypothetical protein
MSKLAIEVIEKGIELSNDDLFKVVGGAGSCACYCKNVNEYKATSTDGDKPIK